MTSPDAPAPGTGRGMVEASRLTKIFGTLAAVDEVTFTVPKSGFFAFVGPNGAGKTTLMRMIYGLATITSGHLTVAGKKLPEQLTEVKQVIGVVPQDSNLDHDLTVEENLLLYGSYFEISRDQAKPRAKELIDFMGLSEKRDARVPHLSGGLRRRLLIARALMNNPSLLILDEPTTGLDPQMRHVIWDKLRDLRHQGLTILLTTHYMEEAHSLADSVAIMNRGRIIALDTPAALTGRYGGTLEEVFLTLTGEPLSDEDA